MTVALALIGLVVGVATGHDGKTSIEWGLWIGGVVLLAFGGAGGGGRYGGGGVSARQLPGHGLLPGQIDPIGLILLGAVPVGIGVVIAVLF